MEKNSIKDLLVTIKGGHRFLLTACILSFIILLTIIQRTVHDDALEELRTLSFLKGNNILSDFLVDNSNALDSSSVLIQSIIENEPLSYFLSQLTEAKISGFEELTCRDQFNYLLEVEIPENDSLYSWVNWFDNNNIGMWLKFDETRYQWIPHEPIIDSKIFQLVGNGMVSYKKIPNFDVFGKDRYDNILSSTYSLIPSDSSGLDNRGQISYTLQVPMLRTFSMYTPEDWIIDKNVKNQLFHNYGDTNVVLGAIKSLGLQDQQLTISGAINEVQKLRKPERSIGVSGFTFSEPIATLLAPLVILLLQINLFFHLFQLYEIVSTNNINEIRRFPWISFYSTNYSFIYSVTTIFLIPVILLSWLAFFGISSRYNSYLTLSATILLPILSILIGYLCLKKIFLIHKYIWRACK